MSSFDHNYYVNKIAQREEELRIYEDCFTKMLKWFKDNDALIRSKPVTRIPKIPAKKR